MDVEDELETWLRSWLERWWQVDTCYSCGVGEVVEYCSSEGHWIHRQPSGAFLICPRVVPEGVPVGTQEETPGEGHGDPWWHAEHFDEGVE